jgi:hypothetical protein
MATAQPDLGEELANQPSILQRIAPISISIAGQLSPEPHQPYF